jgi:hypothetical protein
MGPSLTVRPELVEGLFFFPENGSEQKTVVVPAEQLGFR